MERQEAKRKLDTVIDKSRVHFYKPIQIAEILYHQRTDHRELNLLDKEAYRTVSRRWRDQVSMQLLGNICTSSAKFQDNLFDENAVPPEALQVLGEENLRTNGGVEAYIYGRFAQKHGQLENALLYCINAEPENFQLRTLLDSFWEEPGLKRSIDKIYEIIVYALVETVICEMGLTIEVSVPEDSVNVLREFEELAEKIMCLDCGNLVHRQEAHVYRVGVANAADRGLDLYGNWGPAIQIKHLTLNEKLAEGIVESVSSDRIVIVCKKAEKGLILSLFNQIGWRSKIQSVITEDELINWYEKAMRGTYSVKMAQKLLDRMCEQIELEFPSIRQEQEQVRFLSERGYDDIRDKFWT